MGYAREQVRAFEGGREGWRNGGGRERKRGRVGTCTFNAYVLIARRAGGVRGLLGRLLQHRGGRDLALVRCLHPQHVCERRRSVGLHRVLREQLRAFAHILISHARVHTRKHARTHTHRQIRQTVSIGGPSHSGTVQVHRRRWHLRPSGTAVCVGECRRGNATLAL
jgi:hypothetical protein